MNSIFNEDHDHQHDAIISVTFEVDYSDNAVENPFLANYVSRGTLVLEEHSADYFDWISDLEDGDFYSYEGSLTHPDCDEHVTWVVV